MTPPTSGVRSDSTFRLARQPTRVLRFPELFPRSAAPSTEERHRRYLTCVMAYRHLDMSFFTSRIGVRFEEVHADTPGSVYGDR